MILLYYPYIFYTKQYYVINVYVNNCSSDKLLLHYDWKRKTVCYLKDHEKI